jgi:bacteriorhodopsin
VLSSSQQTVLWIGCAGMGLGALAIAGLSLRAPAGQKHHFVMSFAVCALAFTAYYAMANGYGIVRVGTRTEFFARYLDWVVTTPLLLLGMLTIALPALKGGGEEGRERNALVGGVIGADMFMILTGLFAGLSNNNPVKYGFYAISCLAFLAILFVIWGPVRAAAQAQGGSVESLFMRLASVLSVLWCIYPVLWILGTEGTKTLSLTGEIVVFAIIDLSAKVGFGLLLCTGVIRQKEAVSGAAVRRPVAGAVA